MTRERERLERLERERQERERERLEQLERELLGVKDQETALACGEYYRDVIFVSMQEVRALADGLEAVVAEEYWPYPAYARLLFGV